MSKEKPRSIIVVGLALGAASLACSRSDIPVTSTQAATPEPTPSLSPTQSPIRNVLSETPWPTLSPTPTENPRDRLLLNGLDFSEEGPVTLLIVFEGNDKGSPVEIIYYRDDYSPEEADDFINNRWHPGKGTGYTDVENYGNVTFNLHAAYFRGKRLEAELIRRFIEGDYNPTLTNRDYILERLSTLEGQILTIEREGEKYEFEIYATVQIPHGYQDQFSQNTKAIFDIITDHAIGNVDGFEYFKENQGLFITFCGWGPENSSEDHNSSEYRYTYTRYVLGLRPVSH